MTEIEFLVQLLLNDPMADALKTKLLLRIEELEKNRLVNTIPYPYLQPLNFPMIVNQDTCLHEFPLPWYGTVPPNCKKCGKQAGLNPFVITSSLKSAE